MSSNLEYSPLKPISNNIIANIPYRSTRHHHDDLSPSKPPLKPVVARQKDEIKTNDTENRQMNDENMELDPTLSPRSKTQRRRATQQFRHEQSLTVSKRRKSPSKGGSPQTRRGVVTVGKESKNTSSKLDLLDDNKMTTLPIPPPPLYKYSDRGSRGGGSRTSLDSRTGGAATRSSETQFESYRDYYEFGGSGGALSSRGKYGLYGRLRVHNVAGARYVSYTHNNGGGINGSYSRELEGDPDDDEEEGQPPLVLVEDYIPTNEEESDGTRRQRGTDGDDGHHKNSKDGGSGSNEVKRHGARKQVSISDLRGKLEKRNDSHIPLRLKKKAASAIGGDKKEQQRVSKSVRSMVEELMNANNLRDDSGDNYLSNFKIKIKLKKCVVCEKPLYELSSMILNKGNYKELVCEDCTAKYEQAVRIFENCEFESTVEDIDTSNNSCSSSFISDLDSADEATEMNDSRGSVVMMPQRNGSSGVSSSCTAISDSNRSRNLKYVPSVSAMTSSTLSSVATLRDLPRMKLAQRRDNFFSDELIKRLRGQLESALLSNSAPDSNGDDNNAGSIDDQHHLINSEKVKGDFSDDSAAIKNCSPGRNGILENGVTDDVVNNNYSSGANNNTERMGDRVITSCKDHSVDYDDSKNDGNSLNVGSNTTKADNHNNNNNHNCGHHHHDTDDGTLSWTWFQYAKRRIVGAWRITGIIPFFIGKDEHRHHTSVSR